MALNLKKLAQSIYNGLNPLDDGRGWTSAPPPMSQNQQAVAQTLNGATRGALADPIARQAFIQSTAPSHFNPVTSGAGAVYSYVKSIPAGVVNTVQVPYSVGRVGIANVTGNQQAAARARLAVGSDTQNNLFSPDVPFLRSVAATVANPVSNIYSNREVNRAKRVLTKAYGVNPQTGQPMQIFPKGQADLEASRIKQQFLQDQLNRAGLNQNDSLARTTLKIGAQGGQLLANSVMQADMGNNFVDQALGRAVAKPTVKLATNKLVAAVEPYVRPAVTNAALMAGTNILGTAQQDNPTAMDYIKSGTQGATQGALLSVGGELAGQAVHGATGLAKRGLDTPEIAQLKAQKQASIDAMDTASPKMMKAHVANVNSLDAQIKSLQQSGAIKNPFYEGDSQRVAGAKPKAKAPTELDAMTAMHDVLNKGGTVDEALYKYYEVTGKAPAQGQLALQKVLGSGSLNKSSVNAKLNPEHGKVTLGAVTQGDHTQPILNSHAIAHNVIERGNNALGLIRSLSENDHKLLDDLRGNNVETIAKRAENPQAFRAAAEAAKKYNDYTQAAGAHLGQDLAYRKNYGAPLLFEQAPEEVAAARKAMLKDHPNYGKGRTFKSYDEAARYGLVRRNANFGQDIATDVARRSNDLRQLALARGLEEAYPGQVKIGEIGASPEGTFKQLQISGGQRISLPSEIADEINRRAPGLQPKGLLKGYDTLNANLKYYKLGGGTFHGVTEAGNIGGQQLLSGGLFKHPIQNAKGVAGIFSEKAHQANMQGYAERGVTEKARLAGVTLGENQILGDIKPAKLATKVPIIHQIHEAIFKRQIPEAKLMMFEQQTRGLDPTVPADLAKMRGVARAVNKMGGINRAVDGLTPRTAQRVARAVLATDFTEGRWRTISSALSQGGPEGKIARQMVVGKTVVFLIPTLAAATAAGQINWDDPKDVAKNIADQILDPHFPTPFKGQTGIAKIAKTPETFVSEVGRMLKPVFNGDPDKLSGVKHYVTARSSAALSLINQVKTNQDYFGNPIIARDENGKVNLGKSAINVATNSAPIPIVQGIKTAQGKQGVGEAVINTVGGRVVSDPNDPQMKAFNFQDNTVAGLTPDEQKTWNQVYGSNKDKYNNPITVVPALDSQENAQRLLADITSNNGHLLEAGRKINDFKRLQGLPSDPFFDLSAKQQTVVLNSAIDKFRNPAEKKTLREQNPWLDQYNKDRTAYFDKLPVASSFENLQGQGYSNEAIAKKYGVSTDYVKDKLANQKTKELPEPQPPTTADTYFNMTDSQQKSQYLADHPEVSDYFTAHDQFIREGRAKQGLPQYDKFPLADAGTKKLMDTYNSLPKNEGHVKKDGTKASDARSNWIKSHPNEWAQITAQYSRQAQYGLEQDAQQAAYEGKDFSDKGIKDIVSLAKDLGVTTGGGSTGSGGYGGYGSYARYGSGSSSDASYKAALADSRNPYKYAIARSAGGSAPKAKATIKVGNLVKKVKVASGAGSKPKVSIKKALT